jgi:hypothetical protein
VRRSLALALSLAFAGQGFEAPGRAELALLDAAPPPSFLRGAGVVRIDAPFLSGVFDARLVAACGSAPRVRLQLFPEVGGKILDLAASAAGAAGAVPPAGLDWRTELGAASPPPHTMLFFAVTLLERFASLTPERALGVRRRGGLVEVSLRPVVAGTEVIAVLGAPGEVRERRYRYAGAAWREVLGPPYLVEGAGFSLRVDAERLEAVTAVPDRAFEPPAAKSGR